MADHNPGPDLSDPWLAELVSRAESGENVIDTFESMRTPDATQDDTIVRKIGTLVEINLSDRR